MIPAVSMPSSDSPNQPLGPCKGSRRQQCRGPPTLLWRESGSGKPVRLAYLLPAAALRFEVVSAAELRLHGLLRRHLPRSRLPARSTCSATARYTYPRCMGIQRSPRADSAIWVNNVLVRVKGLEITHVKPTRVTPIDRITCRIGIEIESTLSTYRILAKEPAGSRFIPAVAHVVQICLWRHV